MDGFFWDDESSSSARGDGSTFRPSGRIQQPNLRLRLDEIESDSESESESDDSTARSNYNTDSGTEAGEVDSEDEDEDDSDYAQVETEEDLKKLKVADLKQRLRDLEMPVSGKKAELIQRLLGRGKSTDNVKVWRKSKAKKLLTTLVNDPKSRVHTMTEEEIYKSHEWFQNYPLSKFKIYLNTLQTAAEQRRRIVEEDERIIRLELIRFPRNELTSRGYPYWDTHPSRSFLEKDVRDGRADEMKPMQLWLSRDEYQEFPQHVFRNHVHQEKRKQREPSGFVASRNKKARRMHEKEMKEHKETWKTQQHSADVNELCKKWEDVLIVDTDEEE